MFPYNNQKKLLQRLLDSSEQVLASEAQQIKHVDDSLIFRMK